MLELTCDIFEVTDAGFDSVMQRETYLTHLSYTPFALTTPSREEEKSGFVAGVSLPLIAALLDPSLLLVCVFFFFGTFQGIPEG